MSNVLAATAILVSVISLCINFLVSKTAERRQRMPVIVVVRTTQRGDADHCFELTNVGKGPAVNVIMGFAEPRPQGSSAVALKKGIHESWFNPVHLAPIQPDKTVTVSTPASSNGLGLVYTDALMQKYYTVKTSNLGTRVFEGNHLPAVWRIDSVPSIWDRTPQSPWCRTTPDGKGYVEGGELQ